MGFYRKTCQGGQGVRLYFFGADPDDAPEQAVKYGGCVIETPSNKPHGLYEGTIFSLEG
jgi:predicted enzyme related to lactoylglutathione lyase